MTLDVRSHLLDGPALFNGPVQPDYKVIADVLPAFSQMPLSNLPAADIHLRVSG
jgi:hypothetical protein